MACFIASRLSANQYTLFPSISSLNVLLEGSSNSKSFLNSVFVFFGKSQNYVIVELERRIKEALLQDSRITSVENFEFTHKKNKVFCTFKVFTIYGEIEAEKAVNV